MYLVVIAEPVVAFVGNNDACLFGVDGREGEVLERGGKKWVLKIILSRWWKICLGRTAGLPREHFVMAWKRVDFPTLASPTCCDGGGEKVGSATVSIYM